jgi:L-seryl-tRNA(Ser) seleniumtransferase
VEALSRAFRKLAIPVVGRIKDGSLIFDLRCLEDEAALREQLSQLAAHLHNERAADAPG